MSSPHHPPHGLRARCGFAGQLRGVAVACVMKDAVAFITRRYGESLSQFDAAIRLVPGMVMPYVNKAEALRIMGRSAPRLSIHRLCKDPMYYIASPHHGPVRAPRRAAR